MKRLILIIAMILLAVPAFGQATGWNINGRPNTDWFSTSNNYRNVPLMWMRAIDTMVGSGGTVPGTGSTFYVDSNVSNAGDGSSWLNAVATLDAAIALCTANNGDVIYVAQLHKEDWAAVDSVDIDVIGVTIIGCGTGTDIPTFTFDDTDPELVIGAANTYIYNLAFLPSVTAVVHAIEIEADGDGSVIDSCWFMNGEASGTDEFIDAIQPAALADNITVINCRFESWGGAGANTAIDLTAGVHSDWKILGNYAKGDYAEAPIYNDNDVDLRILISGNKLANDNAGEFAIELAGAATGIISFNSVYTDAVATAIDPGSCSCIENYVTHTTDASGTLVPAPDTGVSSLNATTVSAIASAVDALDGTGATSICSTNETTTEVIAAGLIGFGNDAFNEGFSLMCIYDTGGAVGTAPSGEIRDITDYVSATGTFTVAAFTAALTAGDYVTLVANYAIPPTYNGSGSKIIYCDDGGSDGEGTTWQNAKITLAKAEAIANAGDTILVGENHNENLTTGGDLINIAGVTVIGMGTGDSRPLFDMDVDSDELTLDNAGITLRNLRFRPGATTLTSGIRVEDAGIGCVIEDCSFVDGEAAGTDEWVDAISVDTLASDLIVRNCTFYNTGAPGSFINLDEATIANATIVNNVMFGACTEAPVWGAAAIPTNLNISGNTISNTSSGNLCIEFTGAATGVCVGNRLYADTYGSVMDPGSLFCHGNMYTNAINVGATDIPAKPQRDDKVHGTGRVFYVDAAGDNTVGTTWATAMTTLDAAVNLTTASRGDFIYVAQGHAEDFASEEADLDVAGITVIGLGSGKLKPTITMSNAAGVLSIDADNVVLQNIRFEATVTDVLIAVTLKSGSDYCTIRDCDFTDAADNVGTDEFTDAINIVTTCTGTTIENCRFNAKAAGAATAIMMDDVTDQTTIRNCIITGDYSIGCIVADTTASTDLFILDNILINGSLVADGGLNAVAAINIVDSSSGLIKGNHIASDVATALLMTVADDMVFMDNYVTDDDGDEFDGGIRSTGTSVDSHTDGD